MAATDQGDEDLLGAILQPYDDSGNLLPQPGIRLMDESDSLRIGERPILGVDSRRRHTGGWRAARRLLFALSPKGQVPPSKFTFNDPFRVVWDSAPGA